MDTINNTRDKTFYLDINEDYKILKSFYKILGRPIKLKDFEQMKYKMFIERGFVVLVHEELKINKFIHTYRLQLEHRIRPDTLRLFLYNNGAEQVDAAGNTVLKRRAESVQMRNEQLDSVMRLRKSKFVWLQNSRGFWSKVLSEQLTFDELRRCSVAA